MNNLDPSIESYYDLLEVSVNANEEDIRSSYRRLMLRYHPDKHGAKYKEKFLKIQQAYQIIADPVLKEIYDKNRKQEKIQLDISFSKEKDNNIKKDTDSLTAHFIYGFFVLLSCFYLILAKEKPITNNFLISQWTTGLLSMLILNGFAIGVWAKIQNKKLPYLPSKSLFLLIFPGWLFIFLNYQKINKHFIIVFTITLFVLAFSIGIKNYIAFIQVFIWGGNIMIPTTIMGFKLAFYAANKRFV